MEQRIDPTIRTEYAAGTDPAYIPGLTAPTPPRTEETDPAPGRAAEPRPGVSVTDDSASDGDTGVDTATDAVPASGEAPGTEERTGAEEKEEKETESEERADGAVFEVSDRRGSITADRAGIRFRLDDQEADFHWDEVGAVEVRTGRFGRRFTVTVHMSTRRWFNAEVEAPNRSHLKEWTADLDKVLDAYFEES
ncbi:hypothetical protein PZB75_25280 [Streptomyces sp. AM 4-1-1]|uniref:hypothetical protein n=1 Tax=Streptomyces sp. AM 4-1-1 TaxID=3028710 RepID=UPI0023B88BFB|nr:hypothetical protein [Streptomyces sp. AM 4-1-1]WEH36377.1 hypothetical protein PZB75_25280 [Streptomyces sp. AM 4-1-1]